MSSDAVCRVMARAVWCAQAALLGGCFSLRPVTAPIASEFPGDRRAEVVVTGKRGVSVRLEQAHVEHDTLKGREAVSQEPRAIALADIETIGVSEFNAGRTVLITIMITAAVLTTLWLMMSSSLASTQ